MEKKKKCALCGHLNDNNAIVCTECNENFSGMEEMVDVGEAGAETGADMAEGAAGALAHDFPQGTILEKTCPRCHNQVAGSDICSVCGYALAVVKAKATKTLDRGGIMGISQTLKHQRQEEPAAAETSVRLVKKLVSMRREQPGEYRLPDEGEVILGRHEKHGWVKFWDNPVFEDHVSRFHFKIHTSKDKETTITFLGLNASFIRVNGRYEELVLHQPRKLVNGTYIRIGSDEHDLSYPLIAYVEVEEEC